MERRQPLPGVSAGPAAPTIAKRLRADVTFVEKGRIRRNPPQPASPRALDALALPA